MSTNRLLTSIAIILVVLVAGMGGYYLYRAGFLSNLKLTGTSQEKEQLGTQKVPFLGIGEFTYFPEGLEFVRCARFIGFVNPKAKLVTCEKFFKGEAVAILVSVKDSSLLASEKAAGARMVKDNFEVSGKKAIQLENKGKTITAINLTDKDYLYITNNDSGYSKEYAQIVKGVSIVDLEVLGAPSSDRAGQPVLQVDTVAPEVQQ